MATQDQIENFHQFALKQVQDGGAELSMEELFDLWQVQTLSPEEIADSVTAVQAAIADMKNGDTGVPFQTFADEMSKKYDIPSSE